jgi:preprotein translocase subunit YajC
MNLLTIFAAEGSSSGGSPLFSLGIFLLIPLAMYFLLIRPQRRRAKEQQAMQSQLDVGDEIVTTSGIYGFITGFDEGDRVWIEIDDNVQVRFARAAIQGKIDTAAAPSTRTTTSKDEPSRDQGDDPVDADATDKE